MQRLASAHIPTKFGDFQMYAFGQDDHDYSPHLALVSTSLNTSQAVLVRVHSECITGDLFESKRCDCGQQLEESMKRIADEGGVLIYLRQEGRGIGIINKLKAYNLQDAGMDTVQANKALGFEIDERDFESAITILKNLDVQSIKLMTNNPDKVKALQSEDIDVVSRERIIIPPCTENYRYLLTKQDEMGHLLNLKKRESFVK